MSKTKRVKKKAGPRLSGEQQFAEHLIRTRVGELVAISGTTIDSRLVLGLKALNASHAQRYPRGSSNVTNALAERRRDWSILRAYISIDDDDEVTIHSDHETLLRGTILEAEVASMDSARKNWTDAALASAMDGAETIGAIWGAVPRYRSNFDNVFTMLDEWFESEGVFDVEKLKASKEDNILTKVTAEIEASDLTRSEVDALNAV